MEYKQWDVWQTLIDSKLMSSRIRSVVDRNLGQQKFYGLRETEEGFGMGATSDHGSSPSGQEQAFYLYTAEYVRGWMYVFTQQRRLRRDGILGESSLSYRDMQNLHSLQNKYHVNIAHVEHPDLFTWYEVTGLTLSELQPMTSKMDTFEYHGPTPKVVRELGLATFSMQMADLLH